MTYRQTLIIIASIFVFAYSVPAWPLNSITDSESVGNDMKFPDATTITSASMDFSMDTSLLTFRGNVTVNNSQYTLKCSTLFITPDKDRMPESMQAEGNVRLNAKNGEITCKKASYSKSSGLFILEQNVILQQENNHLTADRITVKIRDGEFENIYCEGSIEASLPLDMSLIERIGTDTDKDDIINAPAIH